MVGGVQAVCTCAEDKGSFIHVRIVGCVVYIFGWERVSTLTSLCLPYFGPKTVYLERIFLGDSLNQRV